MLKKLSSLFGITGGAIVLFTYLAFIAQCVGLSGGKDIHVLLALMYIVPALFCAAGIIASFYVGKKPVAAGAILALSSGLNLISPYSDFMPPELINAAKALSALLLLAAGALALLSKTETNNEAPPLLSEFSRTASLICALVNVLPWAALTAYGLYVVNTSMGPADIDAWFYSSWYIPFAILPALAASAFGLWGSLMLRKKPVSGVVMMLVSGGLVLLIAALYSTEVSSCIPWWLGIPSLLIIIAGLYVANDGRVFSTERRPALKNTSRAFGITGSILLIHPFILYIAERLDLIISRGGSSYLFSDLIVYIVYALFASLALVASLLIRKQALAAAAVMALASILNLATPTGIINIMPGYILAARIFSALLLIAAGEFAFMSSGKAPGSQTYSDGKPDSAGG